MAGPSYGSQTQVEAINVAFEITTAVEAALFDVQYPEHDWRKVIQPNQIISDINIGAQNYAYMIRDIRGAAAFQSNISGNNVPKVGVSMGAATVPLAASAVAAEVTNEDARQYKMGMNAELAPALGDAMRVACENLIETTTFYGDTTVGFKGFLSYTGVNVASAADNGAGSTEWADKSGAQMVADVNAAISYVYTASNTLFRAGVVYLPPTQYLLLSNTYMAIGSGTDAAMAVSALEYLKKNNSYTAITGQPLKVEPIRYLSGAGAGGLNRMVVMAQSKNNQFMAMPMPYRLNPPVPQLLGAQFAAEQKHGSFAVRQLGSMMYVDGI